MKRSSLPLILVALLFLGPAVLAFLLYFGPFRLEGLGMLENPDREFFAEPARLPETPLTLASGERTEPDWARYRWLLIYARMSPCEGQCAAHLERLNQIFLALGRDKDRVRQVLLATGTQTAPANDSELLIGRLDAPDAGRLVAALGPERLRGGRYFVVDPLGNLILSYPPDADQRRMLEDLERLLDVSKIG